MNDVYHALNGLFREGRVAALVTVISQAGPTPRGAGAKCLVMDDGTLVGTVGGGLVEAKAVEEAREVMHTGVASRIEFNLEGIDVEDSDMLCGGRVEVFLEPVSPSHMVHLSIFRKAKEIKDRGGAALLATVVDPARWAGIDGPPKMLIVRDGDAVGSLHGGSMMEKGLRDSMDAIFASSAPRIVSLYETPDTPVEVFVEPVVASSILYVFGGGHVSRQVVPLAAGVGFNVVVIDDREEYARPADFPSAKETLRLPFEGVMSRVNADASSFLVIVTRGHVHDKEVLAQALGTSARYIGMIGSTRKKDIIYRKLLEEGFSEEALSRVYSPIGIEIGAETPEEIAVSIVAELIKVRSGV